MSKSIRNLTLSAMFIALGLVLPMITGHIPQIGNMISPMHIPVLFCGLICGWQYGAVIGLILPLFRHLLFGMPPLFPTAIAMTFELCTYGLVIGLLYGMARKQGIVAIYRSLILSMIAGRLVWGLAMVILLGISGTQPFTWEAFLSGALLTAIPGIIIQLTIIPLIMAALNRAGVVRFRTKENKPEAE